MLALLRDASMAPVYRWTGCPLGLWSWGLVGVFAGFPPARE